MFLEKGNRREWFLFFFNYISFLIFFCLIDYIYGDFVQQISIFENNCFLLLSLVVGNVAKDVEKVFF